MDKKSPSSNYLPERIRGSPHNCETVCVSGLLGISDDVLSIGQDYESSLDCSIGSKDIYDKFSKSDELSGEKKYLLPQWLAKAKTSVKIMIIIFLAILIGCTVTIPLQITLLKNANHSSNQDDISTSAPSELDVRVSTRGVDSGDNRGTPVSEPQSPSKAMGLMNAESIEPSLRPSSKSTSIPAQSDRRNPTISPVPSFTLSSELKIERNGPNPLVPSSDPTVVSSSDSTLITSSRPVSISTINLLIKHPSQIF
mmetsp:Transcript_30852/g.45351  ORF Transcript_30852/g.45351 Transcript_30852/m.45351 type:complete len:254 (-) Transcript_30852:2304-3065(-)